MKRSSSITFGLLLSAGLLLAGCRAATPTPGSDLPRVVATTSWLADVARNVAGDRLQVEVLIPAGVDPHEYQPRPQDVALLEQSQVLIVNGLGYEAWLEGTLQSLGGQRRLLVASNGLTPAPDPSGEHPGGDPHMWMDPLNVIGYVEQIRAGLTQADPDGAAAYARNAEAYIARLHDLDAWVREQVAGLPAERRLLVTNHDALGYFAQAYSFQLVGAVIPSVTTGASPSAQQLAGLITTIRESGAPAIFLDAGENQDLAQQIAAETGVRVVTGLYVETTSAPDGPAPTYLEMIRHDVRVIVDALQ
jgi:ABC-type Zn uptake system ZnuABC Zn-binding protein ZnuA